MAIIRVNGMEEFLRVALVTFIHGMVIKPHEDFDIFLNFERTEIEGIVLLLLGINSM